VITADLLDENDTLFTSKALPDIQLGSGTRTATPMGP
jgi:hypothetical protein